MNDVPATAPVPSVEPTRLLCAAAYLDTAFAAAVAGKLLRSGRQAIAPHLGVDVAPVVKHCMAARRRRLYRDFVLSALLGATVIAVWQGMPLITAAARLVLLGWAVVFTLDCLDRYQILPTLQRHRFHPGAAPPPSRTEAAALVEFERLARGNVTVYRGFHPFAGAGQRGESWSFVTDLHHGTPGPEGRREPKPFDVGELYEAITTSVRALEIAGLEIENRIFVSGSDAHTEPWLFTGSRGLNTNVPRSRIVELVHSPTPAARHYLSVRVVDWKGDMVVSLFLRFAISGRYLYTEACYCLLPSLRDSYRAVDGMEALPDVGSVLALIGRSLVAAVPRIVLAPLRVAEYLALHSTPADHRAGRPSPTFDYGALPSIREDAMSRGHRRYFQKIDHDMHTKLIEKHVLDALNEFLEDHDIDTRSTREQQVNIINSGVMMTGGQFSAGGVAIGGRAKAVVQAMTKKDQS